MGPRRRSDDEVDWKSVFLAAFSHDGAVGASSADSPGAQADDGEGYFQITCRPAAKADADLGPDVDVLSASKGLGPDDPSASKGVDFSPVDEDKQGEQVSTKNCSELSPEISGQKNNGKLPLNKKKSQGHDGKRKPSVNKRRAHASAPEESDFESSLPSRFSKRRKQQLQNSSSAYYSRKVEDVILLDDDEDMEPKEEVNREMSDRLNEPKIYYPSRDDQEAVELTKSDIKCLDPGVFLSSPVINFYIQYIKRTILCNENFRDKFYIFNTYFYGKLEEALHQLGDFPKLRRWWKGVNIFSNAYIILPIHGKEHWSLVIICLPPKERISEPIILHLDSLGMHRSAKILNTVGRFLEKEWRFLSVAEPAWSYLLRDARKETVQVPQQNNEYDCGIFMLYYIEQFIKEAPARFTTDKVSMFNRSWFKPEEASGLRQRIRQLLLQEFESVSRLDNAIPEADASKGNNKGELEADNSSEMVIEVGVGLGNTVESNGGMKVAASQETSEQSRDAGKSIEGIKVAASDEANGESGDTVKSNGCIKVAASQEASEESRGAGKSIEGMKVAALEEASGESGDAVKSTGGVKVAASQEASEEFRDASMSIEGINVAEFEEASEESGDVIKSTGGIKVAAPQEASEESQNAVKSIEGISVAELEEASEESGDAVKSTEGVKVATSQEASEDFRDAGMSIEGINVAESEEASEELRDVVKKSTGGIKVAASQEASEESKNAGKSVEGNVAESKEANEESGDSVKSTRGVKVAASQEASEESRDAGMSIEGINVVVSEETSEELGDGAVKSTRGIKVAASQQASEESRDAGMSIEGINVAAAEEASEELGDDAVKSTGGIKVATSQQASEESRDAGMSIKGINVAAAEEASEELGDDAIKSTGDIKVATSQKASEGSPNVGTKSIEDIKVGASQAASEVSREAAKSNKGISVAESEEASEASGDTAGKSNKAIKFLASEEASMEYSGYPAKKSMEDISDVAVLNKGPTSSSNNKCNEKTALSVLAEAAVWSDSVEDKKGTVKADYSGSSSTKAEKEGELNVIASLERLKGTEEEVIGSTPIIPDVVSDDSGAKRSAEGNEEGIGSSSMPVPPPDAAVCEISGTKVWVRRVYRPTIGWPSGNWCRSSGGSSRNARKAFIEHFCRKK